MNKTKISNISKYFVRISIERLEKSLQYSYRGRRNKKHEMITHWIEHINTGSRQHKKLLSHIDISGAARCADTLDNLQPLLEWLKVEPSFEPMVPNHALRAADSTIMKNEAVGEPTKHDLSGDLPNQENNKLKKEQLVESETRSVVSNNALRAAVSTIRQQEDRRSFHIAAMERRRNERRDQMYMRNRRTPRNSVRSLKSKNQAMENSKSDKFCQLCASSEKLIFEPPKIYCTPCDTRIKRNTIYFTVEEGETHRYFCKPCYNKSKGDTILAEGTSIPKAKLEKKKNDEKTEEWWVQCDKCKAWQHQICALFNREINEGEQAVYVCPNCVEENERKQSDVLGAKELPRTFLSDHIEQRLFKRLKEERIERAKLQGTSYDEIPSAESLVVRVVSSVDKKLEVKTRFREYFRDDNFPTEFPYKSKMIMLFQKIEGAEVCLLAQCVQEFGSECSFPNQRCVYLAFLDSVKYFRPDIKSANGESLRTFVYQEILISYLEYCKLRGFTSCYLWSCPPSSKKVDYILYCHPQNQKTPSTKKLRKWHLAWLRKAAKEGIVVKTTNLYDQFFLQTGECRAKITAARLPYFDGDYWPRKAESIIYQMSREDEREKENKNAVVTKSDIKEPGKSDVSRNASKDQRLMQKLGKSVHSMKENLIVVHLQHCCTHCSTVMVTGNRWICNQCKNFQLCDRCYESEQKRKHSERHPVNRKKKHDSYTVEINNIPVDTKDRDEILECENFETGYKFISFCEKRHYQHDTLRRTKFSYKMALHHLHQCFKRNCNACRLDIDNNQGYRCKGC